MRLASVFIILSFLISGVLAFEANIAYGRSRGPTLSTYPHKAEKLLSYQAGEQAAEDSAEDVESVEDISAPASPTNTDRQKNTTDDRFRPKTTSTGPAPSLTTIGTPQIPADLRSQTGGTRQRTPQKYSYTVEVNSPNLPELTEMFIKVNRLSVMHGEPITKTTLERRLMLSLEEGQELLKSQGYYDGKVEGRLVLEKDNTYKAIFDFTPAKAYVMGPSKVILKGSLDPESQAVAPPKSLGEVALSPGEPAVAADVLAAVNRVEEAFHNRGYPEAKVVDTHFTLDRKQKTLEAEVVVVPGELVRMGPIKVVASTVDQSYLEALRTWRVGQAWNQEAVNNYTDALRQTGLFQAVEINKDQVSKDDEGKKVILRAANSKDALRPVEVNLVGAPERTVGGKISYDTDFGIGLNAYWEHRNLTGHGDRLRLDLPVWGDLQQFTASYRYPYIWSPKQDLLVNGGFLHEDSDAYEIYSAALAVGVERRFSKRFTGSVAATIEGGTIQDPGQEKEDFLMMGLPVIATYNHTNSLLDPTRGMRLSAQVAPYTGKFDGEFNVLRTKFEGRAFIPLFSEKLVAAFKGSWGTVWNADNSQDIPVSLRYYSGGGSSVRGYDYQSVGPRDAAGNPLGGISLAEVSGELRWRVTEDIGLVSFLDGGMVYDDVDTKVFQDMLWGAGLGARYYTPIGPVRVDVAVPLDKRPGDSSWQLYLSIGQSF